MSEQYWRFKLMTEGGCNQNEATRLITVLKRKLKAFPEESINKLFENDNFCNRLSSYMAYGFGAAEEWIKKQQILSNIQPLTSEQRVDITPEKDTVSDNKPNIFGAAITFGKSPVVKLLKQNAREICESILMDEPNLKQVEYIFRLLALQVQETYSGEQAEKLYECIRDKKPIPSKFEEILLPIVNRIKENHTEILNESKRNHLGVTIQLNDPYSFSTKNSFCIWFSNNPNSAMPKKIKDILEERAKQNAPGVTKLVYSRACLTKKENTNFVQWAKENGITLLDFDELKCQGEDLELWNLAQAELKAMREGKGGNPAAASDLVRWISGVIGDVPIAYVDADMPMLTGNKSIKSEEVYAGHPVLLNMGSALVKDGVNLPMENVAFNTDIINFTGECKDRSIAIKRIAQSLIGNYLHVTERISKSGNPELKRLGLMPGYHQLLKDCEENNNKLSLPMLRKALTQAHSNLSSYVRFIGVQRFAEMVGAPEDAPLFQEALQQGNTIVLTNALVAYLVHGMDNVSRLNSSEKENLIKKYLGTQLSLLYKPLVMEFSGPCAVTREILPLLPTGEPTRYIENLKQPDAQILRVLQTHACVAGKTNFTSDNIPNWITSSEEVERTQSLRTDGLSWMPSEQARLSK
ncbi:TPA: Dot/Icm type IV secretion system effector glucosyltransferase Lgt2/LegC8 [Legionella pneumophila]